MEELTEQNNHPVEQQNAPDEPKDKFEKESYSKLSYKEVQKARLYGKMYKVEVPYLDHELHKVDKKRTPYVVFAGIMFALAAVAFAIFLFCAITMLPPVLGVSIDSGSAESWDVLNIRASLVGFGAFMGFIAVAVILGIVGVIAGYLVYNGVKSLQLSTATKEEMAYSLTINRFILSSVVVIIATAAIAIMLLFIIKDNSALTIGIILGVALVIVAGFITMLVKLVRDKIHAKEWFKTLPQEEQDNYRAHVDAIKSVKHKKEVRDNISRSMWR
ncbi:MAG: hypothetical protein IJ542_04120 [Clostridia bacterium]|nr:hypothetical protein [Clostridia bacterium]